MYAECVRKCAVSLVCLVAAASAGAFGTWGSPDDRASFGPLTPSARPVLREYIWPEGKMPDEQAHQIAATTEETRALTFRAEDFRRPYVDWYAPNPSNRTDLAVLMVSGGGFSSCCDAERLQPAIDRFVRAGVTVANLTYRTPRPKGLAVHQSGWEDAQRAIRFMRANASRWGFSPEKIGATGISAGAKLVLLLAASSETAAYAPVDELDALPCNLLFAVPQAAAYVLTDGEGVPNAREGDAPDVALVKELAFDGKTCPMCLFHGGADDFSPLGSTQVYRQLRRMKIPAELHLFADRWHGFHGDMNRGDDGTAWDHWFDRVLEFIRQMNFDGRLGDEVSLAARFPDDADRGGYERMPLWPEGKMPTAQTNQCVPYLEWHLPKTPRTKSIQIIYSGGAYFDNRPDSWDGVTSARRYLNEKGMTVVTLKYRTPRPTGLAKHTSAWQDLQRAVRVVRREAKARHLDPNRIGIMGASAGGHLTIMGATSSRRKSYWPVDETDLLPCNVQWGIALYPAYALTDGLDEPNRTGGNDDAARLAPEFSFDLSTCPMLFLHGDADGWAAMNSVKCWEQLRRMGVQGDLHTLAKRDHCFMNAAAPGTGSYTWLDRVWEFLNHKKFNAPDLFLAAQAVWPKGAGDTMNETFAFETELTAADGPAELRIAAASCYKAELNGAFVSAGPARAPTGFARVDALPVRLNAGRNRLRVEVNAYRCNNFVYMDQSPFLAAEIVQNGRVLSATGGTNWLARASERRIKTPRASFQRGFSEAYQIGGASAPLRELEAVAAPRFIAREVPPCDFSLDRSFVEVDAYDIVCDESTPLPKTRCFENVAPPVFCGYKAEECDVNVWHELAKWRKVAPDVSGRKVPAKLYAGEHNTTGFLQVELACTEPGRFMAAVDELRTPDGDVNPLRIEIAAGAIWDIRRPGRYVLEFFEPQTFKFARLAMLSGKATWKAPVVRRYRNAEAFNNVYVGADPVAAKVLAAAARTLAQCATDVPMDCPSRERAGWLGDSYFSGPSLQLLAGNASVERAFLRDYALAKGFPHLPKGMVAMCYPSDHTDGLYIPTYALWFLLEIEDYVRRTGDRETAKLLEGRVRELLKWFDGYVNADGLLEKLPSWVFVGWDASNGYVQDVNYPANMLYAAALDAVGRLYGWECCVRRADAIRSAVRAQSFDGAQFRDHAVRGKDGALAVRPEATETCQYYAFFTGTADSVRDAELWGRLVRGERGTLKKAGLFPGMQLRFLCLARAGMPELARKEALAYYADMADRTGTLWEHDAPQASCCHAFATGFVFLFADEIRPFKAVDL